jgi:hypothetical protein
VEVLPVVDAMFHPLYMVLMIALRFGLSAVIATTLLQKHGMAELLFIPIMQSAPLLLSGLGIPNGLRKCGKENLIVW